jgi:hypothetical protein
MNGVTKEKEQLEMDINLQDGKLVKKEEEVDEDNKEDVKEVTDTWNMRDAVKEDSEKEMEKADDVNEVNDVLKNGVIVAVSAEEDSCVIAGDNKPGKDITGSIVEASNGHLLKVPVPVAETNGVNS